MGIEEGGENRKQERGAKLQGHRPPHSATWGKGNNPHPPMRVETGRETLAGYFDIRPRQTYPRSPKEAGKEISCSSTERYAARETEEGEGQNGGTDGGADRGTDGGSTSLRSLRYASTPSSVLSNACRRERHAWHALHGRIPQCPGDWHPRCPLRLCFLLRPKPRTA